MDGSTTYSTNVDYPGQQLSSAAYRNKYLLSRRKRCLDILGAVGIGLFFSPVIVVVTSTMAFQKGPIFFGHERIGLHGKRFRCYKFRSMVPEADSVLAELLASDPKARLEWEVDHKLKNDPRVTSMGKLLRKSSLDELPQLWNVLKGDMSLVGPRPITFGETSKYGRGLRYYLKTRPGLTGLWQVSGRNDVNYSRRVALDRKYFESACLLVDLKIALKTILVLTKLKGAY